MFPDGRSSKGILNLLTFCSLPGSDWGRDCTVWKDSMKRCVENVWSFNLSIGRKNGTRYFLWPALATRSLDPHTIGRVYSVGCWYGVAYHWPSQINECLTVASLEKLRSLA